VPAPAAFATRVIAWQRQHGRHGLPWQGNDDPYRIWLSEIMLQQTQVGAVIPYFEKFIARFPNVTALAHAPVDEVLAHWAGLGYYARARNLHAAANAIVSTYGATFPRAPDALANLKGVGRSTANAIAALAFGVRVPILDGNVKRVLARHAAIEGYPGERAVEDALWAQAHARIPTRATHAQMRAYTQGMMDLGAQVCKRNAPLCLLCPVRDDCGAYRSARTEEIPAPRPSKTLPHRTRWIAVLVTPHGVLLERRPSTGIWGGLLSCPEFESANELRAFLSQFVPTAQVREDPAIEHAFTHYRLTLKPARTTLASPPSKLGFTLVTRDALARQALPAPIKKYLLALAP
jgi:A/G-specific adenine glycosylase